MIISVVISTRDRADTLEETLDHLTRVRVPEPAGLEVLVVDNGSSDETPEVIASFDDRLPLRGLEEHRSGASRGRNLGVSEARGDVVAILDDDCYAAPCWLQAIYGEFTRDPDLAILGGRVELFNPRDQPVTIRTRRDRVRMTSTGQLFSLIPGCNMSIRRGVFERVGGFDERMGPGAPAPAAEDVDLIYRAFREGMKVVYDPRVLVRHHHGRRSDAAVARLEEGYRIGRGAFYCKHILRRDREIFRRARWECQELAGTAVSGVRNGGDAKAAASALKALAQGAAIRLFRRGRN